MFRNKMYRGHALGITVLILLLQADGVGDMEVIVEHDVLNGPIGGSDNCNYSGNSDLPAGAKITIMGIR